MNGLLEKKGVKKLEFDLASRHNVKEGDIHLSDACGEISMFKVVKVNPNCFSSERYKKHYPGLTTHICVPYQNAVIFTQKGFLLFGCCKKLDIAKYVDYIENNSELSKRFKRKTG